MLSLLALVPGVFAADASYAELLTQAKGSLLAGDFRAARDILTEAEAAAPKSGTLLTQRDVARVYFYRGVLYWRASPESQALDAWRQALTIAPDYEPEADLLPDPQEQDAFRALQAEVKARGDVAVKLPEDPGDAMIYIDGRVLEPTDTVIAGSHLVQVRCGDGSVVGSWYAYGAPPANYLVLCDGGLYKAPRGSTRASKDKPAKEGPAKDKPARDKPPKESATATAKVPAKSGEVAKNVVGVSAIGLGVAGGAASVYLFTLAVDAGESYSDKLDAAREREELRDDADDYYDKVVLPRFNMFYASTIASGVLLAGGTTLVILGVEGPMVAPVPGGGVFTWNGRF